MSTFHSLFSLNKGDEHLPSTLPIPRLHPPLERQPPNVHQRDYSQGQLILNHDLQVSSNAATSVMYSIFHVPSKQCKRRNRDTRDPDRASRRKQLLSCAEPRVIVHRDCARSSDLQLHRTGAQHQHPDPGCAGISFVMGINNG
ncbi:hypothetical protein Hypma_003446 [Hypsizygus marmoreus]|uniref:Uncharacterized protein n=1 Tax=Hypsizygus marmoreus TaxID=39966 RepID=A0A369J6K3_HYPMA|nr:hypothetical protein Hypma_003446 [Hypsizygus marmoreus]